MTETITIHNYEFEELIRENIKVFDRPLTRNDLLKVTELDCYSFDFCHSDIDVLSLCTEVKSLDINIWSIEELDFLKPLNKLEELFLYTSSEKNYVDFREFSHLRNLITLVVSGGDISDMNLNHMEGIVILTNLRSLRLREFGDVDLSFLEKMPWLEKFCCGWANNVTGISSISSLQNLKELELDAFQMDNLDFLNSLPSSMSLDLCGIDLAKSCNESDLLRFRNVYATEIRVDHIPVNIDIYKKDTGV